MLKKQKTIDSLFFYWLPPIAWMIFIFIMSSRQKIPLTENYVISFIFLKSLHIVEYAVLYFLLFRGFSSHFPSKTHRSSAAICAFVVSILYAFSDEIHQSFVPTREGKIRDVFVDSLGIYLMYLYIKYNFRLIKKIA